MTNIADKKTYAHLLNSVKDRIRKAQYDALKSVNKELIGFYDDIGRMIVERQEKEGWGKSIVEKLATDLQKEFPGIQGFSARNIWYMRIFHLTYRENQRLQPLVAEIGWTKHLVIIDRCKNDLQREFYIRMTRKMGCTKNVLIHNIENQTYEKTLLNQTNFDKALPAKIKNQTIVEYALRQSRKLIGVAKYQIVSKLPVALRKELPAPEQIAKLMDDIK